MMSEASTMPPPTAISWTWSVSAAFDTAIPDHARTTKVIARVDAHAPEVRDLSGDFAQRELGCHRGAASLDHEHRRDERPDLAQHHEEQQPDRERASAFSTSIT